MTGEKAKGKRGSFRQRRAAIVIASVLAFGMLLSVVAVYASYFFKDRDPGLGDFDPQSYLAYYQEQVEHLEDYIEQHGPTEAVLQSLASNYYYLIMIQESFFDDPEILSGYRENLVEVYKSLIKLAPRETRYYLDLLDVYLTLEEKAAALEHIPIVTDLLRDEPDARSHVSLLYLLKSFEQTELGESEAAWLRSNLEQALAEGEMDNFDRYYYAVLLGEYQDEPEAALEQLALVMESESEGSDLYGTALQYKQYLQSDDDESETGGS